jgi:hypothetical protein
VSNALRPFQILKTLNTGPITNHVNFVLNANGTFAYIPVGGLNVVEIFYTDSFSRRGRPPAKRLLW